MLDTFAFNIHLHVDLWPEMPPLPLPYSLFFVNKNCEVKGSANHQYTDQGKGMIIHLRRWYAFTDIIPFYRLLEGKLANYPSTSGIIFHYIIRDPIMKLLQKYLKTTPN